MFSFSGIVSAVKDAWDERQETARANLLTDIKANLEIEKAMIPLTELKKQSILQDVKYLEAQSGIAGSKNSGGADNGKT